MPADRRRVGPAVLLALAVAAAVLLTVSAIGPPRVVDGGPAVPVVAQAPAAADTPAADTPVADVAPVDVPVRAVSLSIPDLGLDDALTEVGIGGSGELVPPPDPAVAGWFAGSPAPGDPGPSVIVGHVDSRAGPGVFVELADIDVGAGIAVRRSDGRTVAFEVVEVYVVPKDEFPTERVYGPVPGPELRLITCGGEFDAAAGRYLRNVVVTAVPVAG